MQFVKEGADMPEELLRAIVAREDRFWKPD
jgi:hypothetical protein